MNENSAGCEKETRPVADDTNTHDASVTLATVNSGKKKAVDGSLGTQSMLKLLPVNGNSAGKNDFILGRTSRTDTGTFSKLTKVSVIAGSTIFKAHMKSLAGFT